MHEGPRRGRRRAASTSRPRTSRATTTSTRRRSGLYAPNGPEPTKALLDADIAHARIKLPKAAQLVAVQPGTVLVQAHRRQPEVPSAERLLRAPGQRDADRPGHHEPRRSSRTRRRESAVSFGFKNNGENVFQNVTAVLAHRGQNNSVSLSDPERPALRGRARQPAVTVPSIDFTQYPDGIDGGQRLGDHRRLHDLDAQTRSPTSWPVGRAADQAEADLLPQVSATLGQQALNQGLIAGLVGLLVVALFLLALLPRARRDRDRRRWSIYGSTSTR